MSKKPTRKAHLPRRDDLPVIKSAALRKAKLIDPTMTSTTIELAGLTREVRLVHKFHRGAWSLFICPSCERRCNTLRAFDGRLVCGECDGLLNRAQMRDKGPALKRLQARCDREAEGGAKRAIRRNRLMLRRALLVARRARLAAWLK